jgi:hypothetical protein
MGGLTVLVIGDDFLDQLEKFQREDFVHPLSRNWVVTDLLDGQSRPGMPAPGDNDAWRRWAPAHLHVIAPDQVPDLFGKHKGGWARIAEDGTVLELIQRTWPFPWGFLDWFERTGDSLILKPGATGESIDDGHDPRRTTRIANGTAGRARKGDVDFAAMLEPPRAEAAAWWDRAHAARGATPWQTRDEIRAGYPPHYSREIERETTARWGAQPSVAAILPAFRQGMPSWLSYLSVPCDSDMAAFLDVQIEVDALQLTRAEYIARIGFRRLTGCFKVIAHGVHLPLDQRFLKELDSFIDAVPDDVWLTVAQVHA